MDLFLDKNKHVGKDLTFVEAGPKKNYKTNEVVGTNFKVLSPELMETFNIAILGKKPEEFSYIKKRSIIEFDNLEVRLYVIDGKPIISRRATGVNVILEQTIEDMLLAVDSEY